MHRFVLVYCVDSICNLDFRFVCSCSTVLLSQDFEFELCITPGFTLPGTLLLLSGGLAERKYALSLTINYQLH